MDNHHCKVGATRPWLSEQENVAILQVRYQDFLAKAADLSYADAALREFFKAKAGQLKRLLDTL